jgi:WD40 repeat protein
VPGVALTPGGKYLVTACHDRLVRLWEVQTGDVPNVLEGHADLANDVDVAPDGTSVLSCSNDGTTRLWDIETGKLIRSTESIGSPVRRCAFSPDGRYFSTASWGGLTQVHDAATAKARLVLSSSGTSSAKLSPDNSLLAVGCFAPIVQIYGIDLQPPEAAQQRRIEKLIGKWKDADYAIREAASDELLKVGLPADKLLRRALNSDDAEVRIRARQLRKKMQSPDPLATASAHSGEVETVCFSPDGRVLATGCRGGDLKIWSVPELKELTALRVPGTE